MIQTSRIDQRTVFYVSHRFLVSPLASVDPDVRIAFFVYSLFVYFDVGIVFGSFFVAKY